MVAALSRGLWSDLAFSATLAAALVSSAPRAFACSLPPSGWFPSGSFPAPANGVLVLRYACFTACDTLPDFGTLVLKSPADAVVPGSVVFTQARALELVVAFRPERDAVEPGGNYTVEVEGLPATAGLLFGPALTWTDALALAETPFESERPAGEEVCCSGPVDSCSNVPCFTAEVTRTTTVEIRWNVPSSIEHYQYVFRVGRESIDPATPWSWEAGNAQLELDATEDRACYVLELKRLTDGSIQTFESRCVEQPEGFSPGRHPRRAEDITAVLQVCTEPPDGYEATWCEARKDACAVSPDEPDCAGVATRCATTGAAGAAGAASVGGAGGTSSAGGAAGASSAGGAGGASSTGGAGGEGGTPDETGGTDGRGGSSGSGGTAGARAMGGTSSNPPAAGGASGAGAAEGESGEAGEPGGGKTVYTKGCGCTLPNSASHEPASFALALALVTLGLRRSRSRAHR